MDKTSDTTQTLDELEKSWNDSKDTVRALLGEDLTKSKSTEELEDDLIKATNDELDMNDEDDGSEDDDKEKEDTTEAKGVKKSLDDIMADDPESSAAMDVEPFLRQLVKSISEQFDSINVSISEIADKTDALQKSMESTESLQKATAKLFLNYGELQKSMADTVEAIGKTPVKSGSVLRKGGDRFAGQTQKADMSKDEIMLKAMHLREEGKLTVRDVTKLENRLNKGIEIPEHIQKLLKEEK